MRIRLSMDRNLTSAVLAAHLVDNHLEGAIGTLRALARSEEISQAMSSGDSKKIERWLKAHPRFTLHFTPTSSSWINLVERWFSELTTKLPQRSAHRDSPGAG